MHGHRPFFSIAIPVHNGEPYLHEALDSALAQTYEDYEIVVSDNASTDATPSILSQYAQRHARISYSRTEDLLPIGANYNRVCRLGRGQWIKMLAHDDILYPSCLQRVAEELRRLPAPWRDDTALVGFREEWIFGAKRGSATIDHDPPGPARYGAGESVRAHLSGTRKLPLPAIASAAIHHRVFLEGYEFDSRFYHQDTFLYLQLCCRYNYLYIPEILCLNRIQPGSATATTLKGRRSVSEWGTFVEEFLSSEGEALGLALWPRLRLRLKVAADAAAKIATYGLMCGQLRPAWGALTAVPGWQIPLLPALVMRAYWREKGRIGQMGVRPCEAYL